MLGKFGATPSSQCADGVLATERASKKKKIWLSGLATPCVAVRFGLPRQTEPTSHFQTPWPGGESRPHACPSASDTVYQTRSDGLVNDVERSLGKVHLEARLGWGKLDTAGIRHHQQDLEGFAELNFACSSKMQQDQHRHRLNTQLRASIQWWLSTLLALSSRPVPSRLDGMSILLSYSDGLDKLDQMCFALWRKSETMGRAGVVRVLGIVMVGAGNRLLVLDMSRTTSGTVSGSTSTTPRFCRSWFVVKAPTHKWRHGC